MRTIWRVIVRTIFWSFERGTWPYDVAVVLIVVFVLLSPRSWFHDRPPVGAAPAQEMVQFRDADSAGGIATYRVDVRLLAASGHVPEPELEHQLHDVVRKNVGYLDENKFQIVRIDPVRGDDGTVAFYDVSIKPYE
jgi:hypothetical protein